MDTFDLLYAIYEEEGYAPSEIPSLILTHNLYGTEIDPRAGTLAAFALTMKARAKQRTFFNKQVEPNICVLESIRLTPQAIDVLLTSAGDRHQEIALLGQFEQADTFGSLIQPDPEIRDRFAAHLGSMNDDGGLLAQSVIEQARQVVNQASFLSGRYAVVIANPPYMGAKNMGDRLTRFVRSEYPKSKADLFGAFISRCRSFAVNRGMVAMITMQSWMFLQSFESLREAIVRGREISVLAHLGSGAFDSIGGDVVSTCAFVLATRHSGRTTFLRLTSAADESGKRNLLRDLCEPNTVGRYDLDLASLQEIPGAPLSYWLDPSLVAAFDTSDRLEDLAPVCQGLATADSSRFVRAWVEVSVSNIGIGLPSRDAAQDTGRRWFPENKGGPTRRWYGNQWHVLDWHDDGAELFSLRPKSVIRNPQHYFKPTVSWSAVGASTAFRYYPAGFIFDNAGMSVIPPDEPTAMYLLGCLNSSVMGDIISALAPTMNLNAGTVADLPIPIGDRAEVADAARKAVEVSRADWISAETSWEFQVSPLVTASGAGQLFRDRVAAVRAYHAQLARSLDELESLVDGRVARAFGVEGTDRTADRARPSLSVPPEEQVVGEFVSYAVGW